MTIKPIIKNQKSKDDGSEEQNQNLGGTNVSGAYFDVLFIWT